MLNKKILVLSCMLLGLTATSCEPRTNNPINPDDANYVQYIRDNKFEKGFRCEAASAFNIETHYIPEDRYPFAVDLTYPEPGQKNSALWAVAQHGDVYSLNDHYHKVNGAYPPATATDDGWYYFRDESKCLGANPTKGACYLELNTSKEYPRDRVPGDAWCHILLSQGFTETCNIREVDEIILTMDLTQKKWEDHMYGPANSGVHACQFLMYIVCKSYNSYDATGYFWFGIPFFDNRYPHGLNESSMLDQGTGKNMYGMPSGDYITTPFAPGVTNNINIDLLPYFTRGLALCQGDGFFTHSTVEDLYFSDMNIGFEIPGTYDCAFEMSNFTLTGHKI